MHEYRSARALRAQSPPAAYPAATAVPSRWAAKNVGGVLMVAAGALVAGVTALSTGHGQPYPPATRALNYGLSGCAAVIGLLLLHTRRERVPNWLLNTLPSVAAVMVCIPSTLDRTPGPLGPLLLTWPVAFAAAVLSPRAAWATMTVTVTAFAVLAAFSHGPDGLVMWVEVAVSSVVICWMVVGLQQQSVRLRETLANLARTDSLTGVVNRRGFDEVLEREQSRMQRGAAPMSLLLLDIDHFKAVNDSWGHQAGDDTLRRLGAVLQDCYRTMDVVGRVGGEEFAVLLPQCAAADARARAVQLCDTLRTETASWPHPITVSVGVATSPGPETSTGELAAAADAALYRAKNAGRDRVEQAPGRFGEPGGSGDADGSDGPDGSGDPDRSGTSDGPGGASGLGGSGGSGVSGASGEPGGLGGSGGPGMSGGPGTSGTSGEPGGPGGSGGPGRSSGWGRSNRWGGPGS